MKLLPLMLFGCLSNAASALNVASIQVFQDGFQDGFDHVYDEQVSEIEDIKLQDGFLLRRCAPNLCCPMELYCGPGYTCWNHERSVQSMMGCRRSVEQF